MTINNYPTHTEVTVFTDNAAAMETFRADSHLLGLRFEVLLGFRVGVRIRIRVRFRVRRVASAEIPNQCNADDRIRAQHSTTTSSTGEGTA